MFRIISPLIDDNFVTRLGYRYKIQMIHYHTFMSVVDAYAGTPSVASRI